MQLGIPEKEPESLRDLPPRSGSLSLPPDTGSAPGQRRQGALKIPDICKRSQSLSLTSIPYSETKAQFCTVHTQFPLKRSTSGYEV